MRLDELIEEQSTASIARKTNITQEVIEKLFSKDFGTLKQTQATGALRIIEREYDVDLSDLHKECQAHFGDDLPKESGLTTYRTVRKKKRLLPKIITLFLLALFTYLAWYFFAGYYEQKSDHLDAKSKTSLADTILGKEDPKQQVQSLATLDNATDTEPAPKQEEAILDETISQESVVIEANDSQPEMMTEDITTEQVESPEASEDTISELNTTEPTITPDNNSSVEEEPIVVEHNRMLLLPQKEMWFRLTNLKTKEKKEFTRIERYEIDLENSSWLFATEDAIFAFIGDDFFEEFGGTGKLFFRLNKKGIHQISENEYREES